MARSHGCSRTKERKGFGVPSGRYRCTEYVVVPETPVSPCCLDRARCCGEVEVVSYESGEARVGGDANHDFKINILDAALI